MKQEPLISNIYPAPAKQPLQLTVTLSDPITRNNANVSYMQKVLMLSKSNLLTLQSSLRVEPTILHGAYLL